MKPIVPWRLLIPFEDFDTIAGEHGVSMQQVAKDTGIQLHVSKTAQVVKDLGGFVMTMHGTMWQKRTAGRKVVDAIFEIQGCDAKPAIEQAIAFCDPRQRWWQFSGKIAIVCPAASYASVSSSELLSNVEDTGAKMSVDDMCLRNSEAKRFLVHLQGNAQQVVSAMSRVNVALQDLVDRSTLDSPDFSDADELDNDHAAPSVKEIVRAARLAPAAGMATQPPHNHPAMMPQVDSHADRSQQQFRAKVGLAVSSLHNDPPKETSDPHPCSDQLLHPSKESSAPETGLRGNGVAQEASDVRGQIRQMAPQGEPLHHTVSCRKESVGVTPAQRADARLLPNHGVIAGAEPAFVNGSVPHP